MKLIEISKIDRAALNEASLSRIWQHIDRDATKSWTILTSWRGDDDRATNERNFKELTGMLRSMGLGFIKLDGYGQEEDENGKITAVKEPSLFIPNISLADAKKLMKKYSQFGIVYSGEEVNDKIMLVTNSGMDDLGKFTPNKISTFYSTVKGRPFVFESLDESEMC